MTDDPNHHALRNLHVVDIRREGRRWSREEADRNCLALHEHPDAPGKLEFVDGKFFHSEAQRLTMLGWLLEMVGADATERLGDPEIWRGRSKAFQDKSMTLAQKSSKRWPIRCATSWRTPVGANAPLDWPDGMHRVEQRLRERDRNGG